MFFEYIIERARQYGLEKKIGGWMTEPDREWISGFLLTNFMPPKEYEVAEVGVFQGNSSLIYLLAMPQCHFHAIDDWKGGPPSPPWTNIKEGFLSNTEPFKDRIIVHDGDSKVVGAAWNTPLDLVMIDGDHEGDYPDEDIKNFMPWVKPGGYMLIDDYDMTNVLRAVMSTIERDKQGWKFVYQTGNEHGKVICYQKRIPEHEQVTP